MPTHAARLERLPNYVFSVIGDRIRQMQAEGKRVYRLDIGNPDLPPPQEVVETLSQSAQNPTHHGYTGYRGIAAFREAVAQHYHKRYGVSLDPTENVLPLIGSKEGIVNLSLAYLDAGDLALIPDVGYPSYRMGAILAGGEICDVPLRAGNDYLPEVSHLSDETLEKAKLIWVNYPNNPTGYNADLEFYRSMVQFCEKHNILLASDNPYVEVLFDGNTAYSALQAVEHDHYDHVVEFMSFSKSYNMAGWRLGAAVGSAEALQRLLKIKSNMDSGHFQPIYDAGITALNVSQDWIDERNRVYQSRRDRIMQILPAIGLSAKKSAGSLYIWAKVEDMEASKYVERALTEAYISIAPGEAYGPGGKDYVRLSLGVPDAVLDEALDKLQVWYSKG
jgi:LL-diaminopimelate aminotransferase